MSRKTRRDFDMARNCAKRLVNLAGILIWVALRWARAGMYGFSMNMPKEFINERHFLKRRERLHFGGFPVVPTNGPAAVT
jgi:hypothetical protein